MPISPAWEGYPGHYICPLLSYLMMQETTLRKTRIFSVFLHRCIALIASLPTVKWVYVPASSHFFTSFTLTGHR